jgi:hypothetical protein
MIHTRNHRLKSLGQRSSAFPARFILVSAKRCVASAFKPYHSFGEGGIGVILSRILSLARVTLDWRPDSLKRTRSAAESFATVHTPCGYRNRLTKNDAAERCNDAFACEPTFERVNLLTCREFYCDDSSKTFGAEDVIPIGVSVNRDCPRSSQPRGGCQRQYNRPRSCLAFDCQIMSPAAA